MLCFNCARHNEETASKVLLWEPQHGHPNQGKHRTIYIDTIKAESGLDDTKEIRDAVLDQVVWKDFIWTARDNSRPKYWSKCFNWDGFELFVMKHVLLSSVNTTWDTIGEYTLSRLTHKAGFETIVRVRIDRPKCRKIYSGDQTDHMKTLVMWRCTIGAVFGLIAFAWI